MARLRTVPRYRTVREALTAASVGLTHQQLADRAGVTRGQLRGALRAHHDRPMPHVTKAVAEVLKVDLSSLKSDLWLALEEEVSSQPAEDQALLLDLLIRRARSLTDKGMVPRARVERATRGSSDRCSRNRWSGFIAPRHRVPMPSQHKYCADTSHLDQIPSGWR